MTTNCTLVAPCARLEGAAGKRLLTCRPGNTTMCARFIDAYAVPQAALQTE